MIVETNERKERVCTAVKWWRTCMLRNGVDVRCCSFVRFGGFGGGRFVRWPFGLRWWKKRTPTSSVTQSSFLVLHDKLFLFVFILLQSHLSSIFFSRTFSVHHFTDSLKQQSRTSSKLLPGVESSFGWQFASTGMVPYTGTDNDISFPLTTSRTRTHNVLVLHPPPSFDSGSPTVPSGLQARMFRCCDVQKRKITKDTVTSTHLSIHHFVHL